MGLGGSPPPPRGNPAKTGAARTAHARLNGTVVLAFVPADARQLARIPGISVGLMSATQGAYSSEQMLLDIGQGARVANSSYSSPRPPSLSGPFGFSTAQLGGRALAWRFVLRRARSAPQLLRPGLLAASIPGGAGYVGVRGSGAPDLAVALDRQGHLAAASTGSTATLLPRIAAMRQRKRLVVSDLPGGAAGLADLRALSATRALGEQLLIVQRTPDTPGHELLVVGAGLAGHGGHELSSHTTNQRGLISSIDLAPSILQQLGLPVPADMRGQRIETDGSLDAAGLESLLARLRVVGARRLKALGVLLGAWALLLLGVAPLPGARGRAARAWAMRVGGLAVMWTPVAVLIGAAIEPAAAVEYATIALACFALAALSDALLPWPRAPLAPAIVSILALLIDALAKTQLLMRSLLGPNPILGARFYGFGNELKSGLAVLALGAIAAALYPAVRSRRAALVTGAVGVLLAAFEGSARLGAGVGGVILVCAGFAVAVLMLAPGRISRGRALAVIAAPVIGLLALALLDLATAHGSGHFTGSILHARSAGDLRDVIVRRYKAAWEELKNHAMPAATALALLYAALAVRARERLLAPVGGDPAWLAALAGGLTAGVIGTLSEDSGPVLLVVAVFALGCLCCYLWGKPRPAPKRASGPAA